MLCPSDSSISLGLAYIRLLATTLSFINDIVDMGIPIFEREEDSNLMCHPRKRELNLIASERIQFLNVFENAVFFYSEKIEA